MKTETLPNFLIVGAAKSGTTSLHNYLNQHPDIFLPAIKETYFLSGLQRDEFPESFSSPIITELSEYRQLFNKAVNRQAIGEACIAYLFYFEQTIPRIKALLGNPTIFIILRNPIDRAFSHYTELWMDGIENLSFEEAIKYEPERIANGEWWWSSQYINMGLYADQVEAYIDAFGNDQVSIFLFEDFAQDPQLVTRAIFQKLRVDDSFLPEVKMRYKATGIPKNRLWLRLIIQDNSFRKMYRKILPLQWRSKVAAMGWKTQIQNNVIDKPLLSQDTRHFLQEYYAPNVLRLKQLTGIDFDQWWQHGESRDYSRTQ